jgi:hypothetical protein
MSPKNVVLFLQPPCQQFRSVRLPLPLDHQTAEWPEWQPPTPEPPKLESSKRIVLLTKMRMLLETTWSCEHLQGS